VEFRGLNPRARAGTAATDCGSLGNSRNQTRARREYVALVIAR